MLSLLGGFQKYSTILLYTIPHNVYVKSLWAFDVKQKEEAAKLIPQYMAILSLQAVAAYLLYIYFSQVRQKKALWGLFLVLGGSR